MSEEETNYWLEIFKETRHAYMSKDGKILSFYDTFKAMKELQNNWNELKKWLEEVIDYGDCLKINYILNKMQELENRKV